MSKKLKSFYLFTLGCRLNQAESQQLAEKLRELGWQERTIPNKADLVVINTCVVTQKAERETRQAIKRLQKKAPGAKLVVAGCWVNKIKQIGGLLPKTKIDLLLPNEEKWAGLVEWLATKERNPKTGKLPQVRALIWVQRGCNNACTYCLTRLVRGKPESRPISQVVDLVCRAVAQGAIEVVLTGLNLSQYSDRGQTWIDLLEAVLRQTKVALLRLGSINPTLVEGDFTKPPLFWAKRLVELYQGVGQGRLARHLHLSLQSGSDKILRLMGRRYQVAEFLKIAQFLKQKIPGLNLTADIIVGFPGESEVDFRQTLAVVKQANFGKIHLFRFSPRPGTIAAVKENAWGKVPERIVKQRAQKLAALEAKLRQQFYHSQIGKKVVAVVWQDGQGLTDNYIPIVLPKDKLPPKLPAVISLRLNFKNIRI